MTVEQGWEDLKRRCPSLAEACRQEQRRAQQRRQLRRVGAISAVAASIIVCASAARWAWRERGGEPNYPAARAQGEAIQEPSAEIVTTAGRQPLAFGQVVETACGPREILLGGIHRVVMNAETSASFAACGPAGPGRPAAGPAAYTVRLARGELYVEVVPGHPFLVETPNALVKVTGTKFDVRAAAESTELVLLAGVVRFGGRQSDAAFVDVSAGQASTILGRSAPRVPRPVDALAATAWARQLALAHALASFSGQRDPQLDSIWQYRPEPSVTNLRSIDYRTWLGQHRQWFAREFPWIFEAQNTLKRKCAIDADYVELLMISGDIWQFHYPRSWDQRIPVFDPAGMRRIAEAYNVDRRELLTAWPGPVSPAGQSRWPDALTSSASAAGGAYLSCLRSWQADLSAASRNGGALPEDLMMFTLRAAAYLARTRTAVGLWAIANSDNDRWLGALKHGLAVAAEAPEPPQADGIEAWAANLGDQVAAAQKAVALSQELLTLPRASPCEAQAAALAGELSAWVSSLAEGHDSSSAPPTHGPSG